MNEFFKIFIIKNSILGYIILTIILRKRKKMKRGKKMLTIIFIIAVILVVIISGIFVFLGRSQTLSVKSIDNVSDNLYVFRFEKPNNMSWKAGSYIKVTVPNIEDKKENNRWLTIATNPDENEIVLLTRNSGSKFKQELTNLQIGEKVNVSWLDKNLEIVDGQEPIVCFASDVGIAAIRPIVKEWSSKRSIILNHLDNGVKVFNKELIELSNKGQDFTYETSRSIEQSQDKLKKVVDKYGNRAIYLLSGKPDDVETMKNFLESAGISKEKIKIDSFKGLK